MDRRAPQGAVADRRARRASARSTTRSSDDPVGILGREVCDRFGNELPFLLKVLAAAEPLSIQAHPNHEQARRGWERENAEGIPVDAPRRNYRDPNHKPELVCALTPFVALKGFRPSDEIARHLEPVARPEIAPELGRLAREQTPLALRALFARLMTLDPEEQAPAAEARDGRGGAAPASPTRPGSGSPASWPATPATSPRSPRST